MTSNTGVSRGSLDNGSIDLMTHTDGLLSPPLQVQYHGENREVSIPNLRKQGKIKKRKKEEEGGK